MSVAPQLRVCTTIGAVEVQTCMGRYLCLLLVKVYGKSFLEKGREVPCKKYDFDLEGCHMDLLINSNTVTFTSLVIVIMVA